MKLRIRGNSVRLRLTQAEVTALASSGEAVDTTSFSADDILTYRIRGSARAPAMSAAFSDGCITVTVPAADLARWNDSQEVSMRAEQPLTNGQVLGILVEKDFACLAPRKGEDESDMFPNPQAGANC